MPGYAGSGPAITLLFDEITAPDPMSPESGFMARASLIPDSKVRLQALCPAPLGDFSITLPGFFKNRSLLTPFVHDLAGQASLPRRYPKYRIMAGYFRQDPLLRVYGMQAASDIVECLFESIDVVCT
jgi:hypothetical protein